MGMAIDDHRLWSSTGKARGILLEYPTTPLDTVPLRCPSVEASEGYPPQAKSVVALFFCYMNDSPAHEAFIHEQSPRSSA